MLPFHKYHALGNDYLVMPLKQALSSEEVRQICSRNMGIGADGILFGPFAAKDAKFAIQIFNPDGSEAEKSGNGLRIFYRYLWDQQLVGEESVTILTLGGKVKGQVKKQGAFVSLAMGQVSFHSEVIPVLGGPAREVLNEEILIQGKNFRYCAATVGNPHCVVLCEEVSPELAQAYGPQIEIENRFPNRTNVQFMKILNRNRIQIEIWERGAGYTTASGTSSSAAAAVAQRLGKCDSQITVQMPGGEIQIEIQDYNQILLQGPVTRIGSGELDPDFLAKT